MISPIADDLSWSLYAPIDRDSLMQNGQKLRRALQEILKFVHDLISGGDDEQWVKFLGEALEHNWSKLCEVIPFSAHNQTYSHTRTASE